jgi:hypothetical protein
VHSRYLDSEWKHSSIVMMWFLMGKCEGTMFIATGIDADSQLVPLAFAIVEKENNGSWGWFLHLVQRVIIGPGREIYVISDMHVRILNVVYEVIPNYYCMHHH